MEVIIVVIMKCESITKCHWPFWVRPHQGSSCLVSVWANGVRLSLVQKPRKVLFFGRELRGVRLCSGAPVLPERLWVELLYWVLSGDGVESSWAFCSGDQCRVQCLCTWPAATILNVMSCLSFCPQPVELQFWEHPFLNRNSGLKTLVWGLSTATLKQVKLSSTKEKKKFRLYHLMLCLFPRDC